MLSTIFQKVFQSREEALHEAVLADDVKKAYRILSSGHIDINIKLQGYEHYIDGNEETDLPCDTCFLAEAQSEPMKRLLRYFGAQPVEALKERWRAEASIRYQRERREEKEKAFQKKEADTRFLDEVLH